MNIDYILDSAMRFADNETELLSRNIASSKDEDYVRMSPRIAADAYGGVHISSVERVLNPRVQSELHAIENKFGFFNAQSSYARRVGNVFGAVGNTSASHNIIGVIGNLRDSMMSLQARPDLMSNRDAVLSRANELVDAFNGYSSSLSQMQADIVSAMTSKIDSINHVVDSIHHLNRNIGAGEHGSIAYNTLLNQRDKLVGQLKSLSGAKVSIGTNDQVEIYDALSGQIKDSSKISVNVAQSSSAILNGTNPVFSFSHVDGNNVADMSKSKLIASGEVAGLISIKDKIEILKLKFKVFAHDIKKAFNRLFSFGISHSGAVAVVSASPVQKSSALSLSGNISLMKMNNGISSNMTQVNLSGIHDVNSLMTAINATSDFKAELVDEKGISITGAEGHLKISSKTGSENVSVHDAGVGLKAQLGLDTLFASDNSMFLKMNSNMRSENMPLGSLINGKVGYSDSSTIDASVKEFESKAFVSTCEDMIATAVGIFKNSDLGLKNYESQKKVMHGLLKSESGVSIQDEMMEMQSLGIMHQSLNKALSFVIQMRKKLIDTV